MRTDGCVTSSLRNYGRLNIAVPSKCCSCLFSISVFLLTPYATSPSCLMPGPYKIGCSKAAMEVSRGKQLKMVSRHGLEPSERHIKPNLGTNFLYLWHWCGLVAATGWICCKGCCCITCLDYSRNIAVSCFHQRLGAFVG